MHFKNRLENLLKHLEKLSCDAILIEDEVNLYYMTGLNISAGTIFASSKGSYLLVDARYFELCKKNAPEAYQVILTSEHLLNDICQQTGITNLALDSENTSLKRYHELQDILSQKCQLIPLNNPIKQLRSIKDEDEIKRLAKVAELGSEGFDFICNILKEGISELEVANQLELFWKKKGGKTVAFEPIIAFGANSSMPHYRAGRTPLEKGQSILIDIGVNIFHYHSDMTRMVFFGNPPDEILKIYEIVKEAQQAALNLCREGTLIGDLDNAARSIISGRGYGPQFSHSLGHGVGLEIHELPVLRNKPPFNNQPLKEGMVITIEPGIYLPGIGGVRLEDTIVITKNGYENLTKRSIEPIQILK